MHGFTKSILTAWSDPGAGISTAILRVPAAVPMKWAGASGFAAPGAGLVCAAFAQATFLFVTNRTSGKFMGSRCRPVPAMKACQGRAYLIPSIFAQAAFGLRSRFPSRIGAPGRFFGISPLLQFLRGARFIPYARMNCGPSLPSLLASMLPSERLSGASLGNAAGDAFFNEERRKEREAPRSNC